MKRLATTAPFPTFRYWLTNPLDEEYEPIAAGIKTAYESNLDTNAFTDAEKSKLSDVSGVNTGDETTVTIQTKRPIKTIHGNSMEGSSDVVITKADVGLSNVDDTSDLDKPISNAAAVALSGKRNYVDGVFLGSGQAIPLTRPSIATGDQTNTQFYEVRASALDGTPDAGFLRLRAGGGSGSASAAHIDVSGYNTTSEINNNITFNTAGSERLRIDEFGNVGIGTNDPQYALDVSSTSARLNGQALATHMAFIINSASTHNAAINFSNGGVEKYAVQSVGTNDGERFRIYNFNTSTEAITILPNGFFGIGATPTAALDCAFDTIRIRGKRTPASSVAPANQGEICWDDDYLYIATGTNQWKRVTLGTF